MSGICDTFSGHIEGEVLEINPGAIQSPDTLVIGMTLRERLLAFKRVIIDLDGERHEFSADSLIRLLEGYEGARDTSRYAELFGTPERAARIVFALNTCRVVGCADCAARQLCMPYSEFVHDDYDALLEWLRGDAE